MAVPGTFATPMTLYGMVGTAIGFPLGGIKGATKLGLGGVALGALVGLAKQEKAKRGEGEGAVPEIYRKDWRRTPLFSTPDILPPGVTDPEYRLDPADFDGLSSFDQSFEGWGEMYFPDGKTPFTGPSGSGYGHDDPLRNGGENLPGQLAALTPMNRGDLLDLFAWYEWGSLNCEKGEQITWSDTIGDPRVLKYQKLLLATSDQEVGPGLTHPTQMVKGLRVIRAMAREICGGAPNPYEEAAQRTAANYWNRIEKPLLGQAPPARDATSGGGTKWVPASLVGIVKPPAPKATGGGGSTFSENQPDFQPPFFERRGVRIGGIVIGSALLITIIAVAAAKQKKRLRSPAPRELAGAY